MRILALCLCALWLSSWVGDAAWAEEPLRALPPGKQPADARLGKLRTLDDYFPFTPVASPEAWSVRRQQLRRQVLVATGLWPMPPRTPLYEDIRGLVDRSDYTVEKVSFQSIPGHFVTGSLYRPKGERGQTRPAVLSPHGHWENGRFHDQGETGVKEQIRQGAEEFEQGGRHPLQARCVQLARMGCIVFLYDMEGYADNLQLAHRPGVRVQMNTEHDWGFFSPQAELRLQNMMGLQTWNSVRALDFLCSLPGVDASRIAVTGASGGGTQTMMLMAIDDRPALSFPAVMVSTAMQGGCTCENAPYLRIGAGNIDFAAMAAPKPLGMTAANDWTKELPTKGFPDLSNLYEQIGSRDNVELFAYLQFEHNYNMVSRQAMEAFTNKHFKLGLADPVREKDYQPLSKEEASVWDAAHPAPADDRTGDAHERSLLSLVTAATQEQIDALIPSDAPSMEMYRQVVGGGWDVILGRRLADVGQTSFEMSDKAQRDGFVEVTGLITHIPTNGHDVNEQLPVLFYHPQDNWNGQVIIWITDQGKADLRGERLWPSVGKAIAAGYAVVGVDLLGQGEFLTQGVGAVERARVGEYGNGEQPWQQSAAYTFGYNYPLFSQRVQDVLSVIRYVQTNENHPVKQTHLIGLGKSAGPIAAAARVQAGDAIGRAAIDPEGFTFASLNRIDDPMFAPGAVKYHDVAGLLALNAPRPLWTPQKEGLSQRITQAAYEAVGPDSVTYSAAEAGDRPAEALKWLIK